ncbi:MAG: tetratricopeptide repeat protein [Promethearchaeota archaeon]
MSKHSIYSILLLWMIPPSRENTPPEAFDAFEKGLLDEKAGRLENALENYEQAVEIFPKFEAAWINLAMVHQDMGNLHLSVIASRRGLEHLPNSSAIWGTLGTFYLQIQAMEGMAEEALRKAIECNSANSTAVANLGILLAKTRRYEEAEPLLAESLEADSGGIARSKEWEEHIRGHLEAVRRELQMTGYSSVKDEITSEKYAKEVAPLLRIADMHIRRGELAKAEQVYKEAIEINLNTAEIWFKLGTLYYQMGRRSEEKAAFRKAIEIDERHAGARIDLASTLIEEGEYAEAENLLRTVTPDVPNNHFAWMNLGKALIAQGKDSEGVTALKRVIELRPDYVNAHFQLGKVYLRRNDLHEAENAFRNTIKYKQDHAGAWLELGIVLDNTDRPEEAEEAWRTAIEYDPNDDAPWVNLAAHLTRRGRCDEAKEALTRAQQIAPNDEYVIKAEMMWKTFCGGGATTDITVSTEKADDQHPEYSKLINTAAMMFDNGEFHDAEQYYRSAIALDPSNPDGWGMLGSVLRAQGRLDEAYDAFSKALVVSTVPSRTVLLNYSVLLKEIGQEKEAEKVLKQLTKEHRDFALGWFNLGNLYLKWSKWKEASKMYKKSLDMSPDHKLVAKIKWNIGVAFKEMKKYKESEKSLLEALELDPSNNTIRSILAQVRALLRED